MDKHSIDSQLAMVEITVAHTLIGHLIGQGGETIKRLTAESGAKINIQRNSDPCSVIIQGSPEQVDKAKALIHQLIAPQQVERIFVPCSKAGLVIGKGGSSLQQIYAESGAHVEQSLEESQDPTEKIFIAKGSAEQIDMAKRLIQQLIAGPPAHETVYIPVPTNKVGLIIGKSGVTIQQICAESGARVEVSRDYESPDPNEKFCIVKGSAEQIERAKQLIQKIAFTQSAFPYANPVAYGGQQPQSYGQHYQHQHYQPQTNYSVSPVYGSEGHGSVEMSGQNLHSNQTAALPSDYGSPAPIIDPETGTLDYSPQWIVYYRAMGQHELADAIQARLDQQKERELKAEGQ